MSGQADATGGHAATAVAVAAGGIVAQAYAGTGNAFATVINDGSLIINADAHAIADTNALAVAVGVTGIYQQAQAFDGHAAADIANDGTILITADADATGLVAQATAIGGGAMFGGAIFQSAAAGNGSAEADFLNTGDITILADADANGSVIAYANAIGGPGVQQLVFGTGGDADASLVNEGSILLGADAHAYASNSAFAFALYVNAVNNAAFANSGDAQVDLVNSGEILVGVNAVAEGGNVAGAVASASHMIGQFGFAFGGNAAVTLDNDGAIAIDAAALAVGDLAFAQAFVLTGLYQNAFAIGTGSALAELDNSGTIDVAALAAASGVTAYATAAVTGGVIQVASAHSSTFGSETLTGGTFVQSVSSTPTGKASVALVNSGAIDIGAVAAATGESHAEARASVNTGVLQFVSGSDADALIDNSGSLTISAAAVAEANGNARAYANVAGIAQAGTALANSTTQSFQPGGTVTLELSSIPVGAVQLELVNSGDIAIVGAASAVAGDAGLGGLTEAVAYAGVAGIDQSVLAQTASALFDNDGTILIAAQAKVVSAGIANGVALASGIDQAASAWAVGGTAVFPPGASTPSTFTTFAYPAGPASVNFDNSGNVTVVASVEASGQTAFGGATAQGVGQFAAGTIGSASLANSGSLNVIGRVESSGDKAFALAAAIGVVQGASGTEQAVVSLDNSGDISIAAIALADGETGGFANVTAYGIIQQASGTGAVAIDLANSGAIELAALASGVGGDSANGFVFARGLIQAGQGSSVDIGFDNDGTFELDAIARAEAGNVAYAAATILGGIGQAASVGSGSAELVIANAGTIEIVADAEAIGGSFAQAWAIARSGVAQFASGENLFESMTNDGEIVVGAFADAAAADVASALAIAGPAMVQLAGGADVHQSMTNSGTVTALAVASAISSGVTVTEDGAEVIDGLAFATAVATGIAQSASGAAVTQQLFNDGTVNVVAQALASAPAVEGPDGTAAGGVGLAYALAYGVNQFNQATASAFNSFVNDGEINVLAEASAVGTAGSATAAARGLFLVGGGGTLLTVDVANNGVIDVEASAISPFRAYALSRAIYVGNNPGDSGNPVDGAIVNSGTINAMAFASGAATSFVTGTGTTATTIIGGGSSAFATGIAVFSGANNLTITNSGSINVDAVVADGGTAIAMGIVALANAPTTTGPDDVLTITNDGGDIIVRQSTDGGESWSRGLAINVAGNPANNVFGVPNKTVVNLLGDGYIYGNIAIQDGDEIRVADGTTYFDGIINPQFLPADGLDEDDLDSGLAGVGSLIIGDGGNLVLADPRLTGDPDMYDGPAYALVDSLTVASDGTLTFELQPEEGGVQPVGSYPQVFANTANLDGTLVAELTVPGGLIADSYSYDNVIDADVRAGQFDQCLLGGAYANSLLVGIECSYDNQANVDLAIERVAFNAVSGLNQNGTSVGEGLECIYDVTLTGGIVDVLADLFLFTNAANYNTALNMLSGSVYANYLQSFPSLGVHHNDILAKATDCEIPALAGSVLECRASSPIHLWGQADYQWRKADGDIEAGTAKSRRVSAVVGLDVTVGGAGIVGGSIGYVTNHVKDNQFGDDADADGLQVGLYGVYDPGTFYVKAMTTYSWYDGDSDRNINFAGLAPGATFASSPQGDPDVRMWTAGVHAGARFALGGNSVLTPYLNYDYVNAKLKSFQETGGGGADLSVYGGRARHSFLTGGVKWATQMGGVVPEVNLGYRYRFGDRRSDFNAAFLDDRDCDFDIISAAQKRGTFLAGLSVGGKMGPVDLRIGYEGEFNSDVTSHAGNFKFVLPLGGKKVAAAAPAPVLAPPMPAEEVAPAPVEAPPPPPPSSSGERGR